MKTSEFSLSREKHLDHLVKVVPFIVFVYAVQCYTILQITPEKFFVDSMLFLGIGLAVMISSFITYDLTHRVEFFSDSLVISIKWLTYQREIPISDIIHVESSASDSSFGTVLIKLKSGKTVKFYFIDNSDKIILWFKQRKETLSYLDAA
jgi:hypothetical protein